MQLATAMLVFLLLSALYSSVKQYISTEKEAVPLSQIASDIGAGKISSVTIEGDAIKAAYADKKEKLRGRKLKRRLRKHLPITTFPKKELTRSR